MIDEIIAISIIALIIGGAILYIIKAKKSGKKCIGCPNDCSCKHKANGTTDCCCNKKDEE